MLVNPSMAMCALIPFQQRHLESPGGRAMLLTVVFTNGRSTVDEAGELYVHYCQSR